MREHAESTELAGFANCPRKMIFRGAIVLAPGAARTRNLRPTEPWLQVETKMQLLRRPRISNGDACHTEALAEGGSIFVR